MGNKINRCHFIPKVYLRKWFIQNESNDKNYLYCYDYLSDQFVKSSQGSIELGLNDKLFQKHKLYSKDYENEIGDNIENHYNEWLCSIERFYRYVYEKGNVLSEELLKDTEFMDLSYKSFVACEWMLKFAFVQWIRYPDLEDRFILFNMFRELILKDDTEYIELFSGEYIKIPTDKKIIATIVDGDKDVFKYAFFHIDQSKMKNLFNHLRSNKYIIFIDHSKTGQFVTSTYPISPLFLQSGDEPYGFMFPLSPHFNFRIEKGECQKLGSDNSFPYQPCESPNEFVSEISIHQFLGSPKAQIICGNKYLAKSVLSSFSISLIRQAHKQVQKKLDRVKNKYSEQFTFANIYLDEEENTPD